MEGRRNETVTYREPRSSSGALDKRGKRSLHSHVLGSQPRHTTPASCVPRREPPCSVGCWEEVNVKENYHSKRHCRESLSILPLALNTSHCSCQFLKQFCKISLVSLGVLRWLLQCPEVIQNGATLTLGKRQKLRCDRFGEHGCTTMFLQVYP